MGVVKYFFWRHQIGEPENNRYTTDFQNHNQPVANIVMYFE